VSVAGTTRALAEAEGLERGAVIRRPTRSLDLERLLVIADAAAQIASPSHEAYLRHRFCVGTRLRKHVADLSDLTFRLLHGGVLFQPKRLARGVLIVSSILAKQLLSIRVGERMDLAVADIEAKWIQVAVQESSRCRKCPRCS
jgi:hypothetical protein